MDYTKEEHAESERISTWVYNIYFKGFPHFKEDLITEAVIRLWKHREDFDSRKSKYVTWAVKVAYSAMASFLRKQEKFSEDIAFLEENEDMYFSDYLFAATSVSKLPMPILISAIKNCVHRLSGTRVKEIIRLYLNHRSCAEISKIVGIARQNVHTHIRQFRKDLASALELFR
jgi:RNA polymerase sigma factor (sigma-70 family)